jgi:hypothetical protein
MTRLAGAIVMLLFSMEAAYAQTTDSMEVQLIRVELQLASMQARLIRRELLFASQTSIASLAIKTENGQKRPLT